MVTNARVYYHYTRGCGCIGHPAFPAPSVWREREFPAKLRAHRAARMRRCVLTLSSPLPPRASARGGEGSGVGGLSANSLTAVFAAPPPTLDPSPPLRGGRESRIASGSWEMVRSPLLTIFWHCGGLVFSFRTVGKASPGQPTVNGFVSRCGFKGSGNADSQRKVWSSGWSGRCRAYPRDSGCVHAHPAYWRASASYRPLRAVWAVAPGHSGVARDHQTPSALGTQRTALKEFSQ